MPIYEYDSISTTNAPLVSFPMISGLTISGTTPSQVDIPMILTSYSPPTRASTVGTIGVLPIIQENFAYGGQIVSSGNSTLPKLKMEGFIDTPCIASGGFQVPNILLGGIRLTYSDLINMYLEGRATASGWGRIDPLSFRDPYGRVFNSPSIMDFTATYVEAVPGRTNVTLQLLV